MLSRREYDRAALFLYSTEAGLARTVGQACRDYARKHAGEGGMRATLLAASLNDVLKSKPAPAVFAEQPEIPTPRGSRPSKSGG